MWILGKQKTKHTSSDALRADLLRDLLEGEAHLALLRSAQRIVRLERAPLPARLHTRPLFRVRADLASGQHVERRKRHAYRLTLA